jgi:hypothetical protein
MSIAHRFKDIAQLADRLLLGGRRRGSGSSGGDGPQIGGFLKMELRERGKLVTRREGHNIWTLSGREFIVETITLAALTPSRAKNRDDALRYFGFGIGITPEVAEVTRLVSPVEYQTSLFLAPAQVPVTFPSASLGTARTSVQLRREYSENELSLPNPVVLTEFGCFTDGNPAVNNEVGRPTDLATAGSQAPVGYKPFDPFTKNSNRTLEVIYELRVV